MTILDYKKRLADIRKNIKITKQNVGEKKDVAGISCLKDESGGLKLSVHG